MVRATLADGRTTTVQTAQRDERLGLALVRFPGARATPLPPGDAMSLRTGDRVVLIGRPERAAQTALQAVVRNTARSDFGLAYLARSPAPPTADADRPGR